jgi:hypothetical protein
MAARHEVAIVANGGDAILFFGGPIDRYRLAKYVPITDDDLSGRALVAEVLRFRPDDHAGKQMIVSAERRIARQGDIILKPSAASDLDVRANDAVVADTNFFVEFRTRIYDGGMGYDCGHTNQLSEFDLVNKHRFCPHA